MDDNKITSTDFDYDVYTGGSSESDTDSPAVSSTDFDYGVYSGENAMEYLRQENERLRLERERSKRSEAELRREEYEKKFSGMSADEIFAAPPKKKEKPKEDFSDFFSSDAAEKAQQKQERKRQEEIQKQQEPPKPAEVETMLPGEDEPSSLPYDDGSARESVLEMEARLRIRTELAQERRQQLSRRGQRRYYRRRPGLLLFTMLFGDRFGDLDEAEQAFSWYIFWFFVSAAVGGIILALTIGFRLGLMLICAAIGGAIADIFKRCRYDGLPFAEAVSDSRYELIGIGIAAIIGMILEFT